MALVVSPKESSLAIQNLCKTERLLVKCSACARAQTREIQWNLSDREIPPKPIWGIILWHRKRLACTFLYWMPSICFSPERKDSGSKYYVIMIEWWHKTGIPLTRTAPSRKVNEVNTNRTRKEFPCCFSHHQACTRLFRYLSLNRA